MHVNRSSKEIWLMCFFESFVVDFGRVSKKNYIITIYLIILVIVFKNDYYDPVSLAGR